MQHNADLLSTFPSPPSCLPSSNQLEASYSLHSKGCGLESLVPVWSSGCNVCVSGIVNPLPKQQTMRICDGHEDLSSYIRGH